MCGSCPLWTGLVLLVRVPQRLHVLLHLDSYAYCIVYWSRGSTGALKLVVVQGSNITMLTILLAQVVNSIIDDTVNSQVVMDSSSAPNYDIWVTNIDGPGAKVSWRNLII
jgi:hypothetical protein